MKETKNQRNGLEFTLHLSPENLKPLHIKLRTVKKLLNPKEKGGIKSQTIIKEEY